MIADTEKSYPHNNPTPNYPNKNTIINSTLVSVNLAVNRTVTLTVEE